MERMTMNVREMAQQLGISMPKAYELVKQDGFPVLRLGKRIIIPVVAFQNWLTLGAVGSSTNKRAVKKYS
jgi:excisionase family DNA binding protein